MAENTSFSIIIPTYNRADLISITLDSVFAQNYPYCEIIVVDNCSTDNTIEVLQPAVDAGKIRLIRHEQNFGRSKSRNTGFENATGEWVLFLDSDDLMTEGALSFLASKVRDFPQAGLIAGIYLEMDEEGNLIDQTRARMKQKAVDGLVENAYLNIINNFYLPMGSYTVHRDTVMSGGGFESNLEPCEDYDFCLRMVRISPLAYFNKPIVKIRKHEGNTHQDPFYKTSIKVAHRNLAEILGNNSIENKKWIISELRTSIANVFFNQKKFKNAFWNYILAAYVNPKITINKRFYKQVFSCLVPESMKQILKSFLRKSSDVQKNNF